MGNINKLESSDGQLGHGLKPRQIAMISIGGVIGAGLFVGSSNAVAIAGPAVIVSYLFAALLVILVMQMLGEMAAARPDTGTFSSYADIALGRWAGFTIGWLYWWFYVLVIAIEAIVAGNILGGWLNIHPGVAAFGISAVLVISNCLSVKNFGEVEYWLSIFKVAAIIIFILLGIAAIFGLLPGSATSGIDNLWINGGFAPNGYVAIITALLTAMFSFQGSEVVTIAAAESEDPKNNIKRAIRSVVWRLALFYLGSMAVVVCLVPWNEPGLADGSYQAVLRAMNIPYAPQIMTVVVMFAVTSCLNSAIYTASRMCFSLARRGDAPAVFAKTTCESVPRTAIFFTILAAAIVLICNYSLPKTVFSFLLSTSGAIALIMYLVIAVTQLRLRNQLTEGGEKLLVKMWLFPYLTIFTMILIVAIFIIMALFPQQRIELISTLGLAAVLMVIGVILQVKQPEISRKRSGLESVETNTTKEKIEVSHQNIAG
ncbi:amino acid permease [Pectobacterium brasiliense]|uniref:amino acid permease n=1 Tax=Pectobacterium brasiliense TaxID=180957 RepID=UPI00191BAC09|nr:MULTISPECIES: amino acid permease [Pectobacterium]